MTGSQDNDAGAADLAARGQGCAGGEGGSSAIPGHHPGTLAAAASSAGRADAEGHMLGWCDFCSHYHIVEPDGMDGWKLVDREGQYLQNPTISMPPPPGSPATPEGDAISKAAVDICERWLRAFGSVEIKHTTAREYAEAAVTDLRDAIAALRSLPPQDGEREQIERLTAERDAFVLEADALNEEKTNLIARAEKAEAERDAIAAATVEGMKDRLRKVVTFSRDAALIRDMDFTPADAKAALDAMIEGAAMTECAAFSAGYEACERDGKSAALTAQPVATEPVAWVDEQELRYLKMVTGNNGWGTAQRNIKVGGEGDGRAPLYAHPATPAPVEAGRDWYSDCRVLMANLDAMIEITGEAPEDDDGFMVDEIREAIALRAQSAPVGGEGGEG